MSRDIEDRLRAAYAARADAVTESSLRRLSRRTTRSSPLAT